MEQWNISLALLCLMGWSIVLSTYAQNSQQDYLDAHKAARAEVNVHPLTWDEKVAAYAQNYARQRAADCALVHSQGAYGENIAVGGGGSEEFTGREAFDLWVEEKPYYDHESNSCVGGECLHYTQVVWSGSTRVGCARVHCNNGQWFVTCNYDPPGNIIGQSPY